MVRLYIFFLLIYSLSSTLALGQENEEAESEEKSADEEAEESFEMLIQHFDDLDRDWHGIKPTLDNYNGIHIYCSQDSYKEIVKNILLKVHHYDTVLMNKIIDPHYFIREKEKKRLLKEIEKFEHEYSIPNFLNKLDLECKERKEIEADRKDSKNDIGERSYDGQRLIVEQEIEKYMMHITEKLDHIDKYLHHLHISEIK